MRDAHNQNIHITGYPTEKPQELLRRIVLASSNPGDLVLDCFAGSGTTLVVAEELSRRWIGVDNAAEGMRTMLRRFAVGMEPMGDFVNRQKDDEPELSLALFENSETPTASSRHVPISDFTLLAERGREDELKNVLAETTEAATPA